ncbi:YhbP family protein [Jinshanibacter sp. LJY008]|uniref:UPF0306 protein LPW36_09325 n=1 Tax=Limnobaculum eriocheiris TaxID=2897391 RepID=A0A9X1SKZ2_9GAMM|nr:YhbP family protein [Limnobaculum eriocheiris]MCD1126200.1 YhbP family protein [Limnobaculum eriocheiris]
MTTDPEHSLKAICRYLKKNHVVSLCTMSTDELWCASCFYLFDMESMALIIMSEPHARHGKLALANPQVAGTIAAQTRNIALIQGIQYTGKLQLLTGEDEQQAREKYIQRFPIAKFTSAPLWQLRFDEIKMTDNKSGFGKKRYWQRSEGE